MIDTYDRYIPEISTEETSLIIILLDPHSILDMIRFLFRKNGHATISLLLGTKQIRLIS